MMKKSQRSPKRPRPSGPFFAPSPFSGVDPDTLKSAFIDAGKRRQTEFPEFLARLEAAMRVTHPLSILSMIAGWGVISGVNDHGDLEQGMIAGIMQHHIELLQALCLRVDQNLWGKQPGTPETIQIVVDDLKSLADAFHERRLIRFAEERSRQERTVLALQERLRGHTQVVRNWGYRSEVRRISRELFSPLDDRLRE
jgi:hypothetical protein